MIKRIHNVFNNMNTSWQTIVFVVTVLVLFMFIVAESLTIVQMRYHINGLEDNLFEASNENKLLVEQIEKTSTERYVEQIARDKLGMVRTNEAPIQVNEVNNEEDLKNSSTVLDSKDKTGIYLKEWYNKLGEWFVNSKKKG